MSAAISLIWPSKHPEAELDVFFDRMPVGIARFTGQGDITAVSPAWMQILDRVSTDSDVRRFTDLIPTSDRGKAQHLLLETPRGSRGSFQIETPHVDRAGSTVWVRWTAWRVQGSDASPDYGLIMAEEISEERQSVERLRQAEGLESIGRLAGGVAHDFSNLLTAVLLQCDLLLSGLASDNSLRKYAEEIRSAGLQATVLIRQLLTLARPQPPAPQLLSLNDIADGMRSLLARLIAQDIELSFHLEPNLGPVLMDPAQVQQILLNLVLNARDALPDGGRIVVETSNCEMQIFERPSGHHNLSGGRLLYGRQSGQGWTDGDRRGRNHLSG
jgi:two-component system cell cycle sensor histidine kinase/response regulator CckA